MTKIVSSKTIVLASLAMFAFSCEIANADNAPISPVVDKDGFKVKVMTADLRPASSRNASDLLRSNKPLCESPDVPMDFLVAYSHNEKTPGKEVCMNPPLTDEQVKRLLAIRDQNRIDTASKHAELISLSHKMTTLMGEESIDRRAVTELFSKMSALRSDLAKQHLELLLDTAEVFTPEQRSKMQHLILRRQASPGGDMPFYPPPLPPHAMPAMGIMPGDFEFSPPPFGAPRVMGFFNPGIGPHHPPPPPGFGFGGHPIGVGTHAGAQAHGSGPEGPSGQRPQTGREPDK